MIATNGPAPLALWGGVECTINRVQDRYVCQLSQSGHAIRTDDLERFAALGLRVLRYPILWERTAPDGLASADWRRFTASPSTNGEQAMPKKPFSALN